MKSDTLRTLPFEPDRFLNDEHVAKMNAAQRGVYISALCWEWLEGDLPDEVEQLAFLLRLKRTDVARAWPLVRPRFEARENGRLYHPRLEADRLKAADRLARWRESGSRGGVAKATRSGASGSAESDREPVGTLEGALEADSTIKLVSKSVSKSVRTGPPSAALAHQGRRRRDGADLLNQPGFER